MAGELERLLIRIEADTALLRKALADADKGVGVFTSNVDKKLANNKRTGQSFETAMTASFRKVTAAFAAFSVASKSLDLLMLAGDVGKLSAAANLSAETFQAYAFAAQRAGIANDTFAAGTRKFAVNMSQLRADTGSLNSFLKDHLPVLREQLLASKNQDEAYRLLSDAILALQDDADKTTLVLESFGKAGYEMGEIFGQGAAQLDATKTAAAELGAIMDAETAAAADRTKKAYEELVAFLNTKWQQAVVGAAKVVDNIRNFDGTLPGPKFTRGGMVPGSDAVKPTLSTGLKSSLFESGGAGDAAAVLGAGRALQSKASASGAGEFRTELDFTAVDALADIKRRAAAANKETFEGIRLDYESDLERFRRLYADKELSLEEFEEARAGLQSVASGQVAEALEAEASEYRAHFAEIEGLITNTFMSHFSEALRNGQFNAQAFFTDLLAGFAEVAVQAAILKPIMDGLFGSMGAPGSSLLGGLFAPGRAAGGSVNGGRPYVVGERGPELFVPNRSGSIMRSGAAGGMNNVTYVIDARGADVGVEQRLRGLIAAQEKQRVDPVSAVSGYRRRFPTRGA